MTPRPPDVIFDAAGLKLLVLPDDGPRGAKLRVEVADGEIPELLEGQARALHLAVRQWIRYRKSLRGETPRGVRGYEIRVKQYRAPRAAAAAKSAPAGGAAAGAP